VTAGGLGDFGLLPDVNREAWMSLSDYLNFSFPQLPDTDKNKLALPFS